MPAGSGHDTAHLRMLVGTTNLINWVKIEQDLAQLLARKVDREIEEGSQFVVSAAAVRGFSTG